VWHSTAFVTGDDAHRLCGACHQVALDTQLFATRSTLPQFYPVTRALSPNATASLASIDFKPHACGLPAVVDRPATGDLIQECFFIWRAVGIRPTRQERIRAPQL
jgi:hypothetical protein